MYMSPEQLQDGDANGQGYLGTAVDVWAAGVLLIVMLLGGLHICSCAGGRPDKGTPSEEDALVWPRAGPGPQLQSGAHSATHLPKRRL